MSNRAVAGYVLHGLIAACMVLAGSAKLLGYIEQPGPLNRFIVVIGVGETVTAILLIAPRIWSLGLLLASSFWGGAICVEMMDPDSMTAFSVPAGFLLATWIGAYLRDRRVLFSLQDPEATVP